MLVTVCTGNPARMCVFGQQWQYVGRPLLSLAVSPTLMIVGYSLHVGYRDKQPPPPPPMCGALVPAGRGDGCLGDLRTAVIYLEAHLFLAYLSGGAATPHWLSRKDSENTC